MFSESFVRVVVAKLLISIRGFDRDINFVIMDYLINEGYPSAAKKFAIEANIQPAADVESIQERVEIRNAIHAGDIEKAIERINELNPQVSEEGHRPNASPDAALCYD